jgi:3-hydroxyacyl-CoA dehydrogenase
MPLGEALTLERETFLRLKEGEQARALRHVFFAERAAKAPGWLRAEPAQIDRIAVVGGGTMGAGIAYAALNAGLQVTLLETDADGAARARERIERLLGEGVRRGLFDEKGAADRRTRLQATQDYAAASGCGLAIEAAFESMAVKADVFSRLEAALPGDAVLATNTSYLDIDAIAAGLSDPARVLGLHFFAPAHVMKLLEVVRARHSSDRALATGFALGKRLRKVPVLAGVCDGFIGNRILKRYREAADGLLIDGATPWQVDAAMVDFGYAMGPYAAQDLSGLDIAHAQRRREDATRDPKRRYVPIADRLVQKGRLGRKSGAGWYRYPDGAEMQTDPAVEEIVREEARAAGVARRAFTAEEIRERLLCAMINEAAFILEEGIAQSARDIDLVTVFGYGFPRWRGGLMVFADGWGAARIAERLRRYAAEDPGMWTASPLLLERAETGRRLAEIGE